METIIKNTFTEIEFGDDVRMSVTIDSIKFRYNGICYEFDNREDFVKAANEVIVKDGDFMCSDTVYEVKHRPSAYSEWIVDICEVFD